MKKYNLQILALQETKQKDSFTSCTDGYVMFNSGRENRLVSNLKIQQWTLTVSRKECVVKDYKVNTVKLV